MASSLVNNKYRITRRIGGGSFGEIYMGVGPNNEKVAVKFERHGTRCPQLRHEYKVYRELTGCHGFCQVGIFFARRFRIWHSLLGHFLSAKGVSLRSAR
jgi:predicted Ser/Thr protein kinase